MEISISPTQSVSVIGLPVKSGAVLSNTQYSTSNPAVFIVEVDPAIPNGIIIIAVAPGTATLTETATETEADGTTTEIAQGVATVIVS